MKNIPMDEIELDALKSAVDLSFCKQREVCTWNKYVPCTNKRKTFSLRHFVILLNQERYTETALEFQVSTFPTLL